MFNNLKKWGALATTLFCLNTANADDNEHIKKYRQGLENLNYIMINEIVSINVDSFKQAVDLELIRCDKPSRMARDINYMLSKVHSRKLAYEDFMNSADLFDFKVGKTKYRYNAFRQIPGSKWLSRGFIETVKITDLSTGKSIIDHDVKIDSSPRTFERIMNEGRIKDARYVNNYFGNGKGLVRSPLCYDMKDVFFDNPINYKVDKKTLKRIQKHYDKLEHKLEKSVRKSEVYDLVCNNLRLTELGKYLKLYKINRPLIESKQKWRDYNGAKKKKKKQAGF